MTIPALSGESRRAFLKRVLLGAAAVAAGSPLTGADDSAPAPAGIRPENGAAPPVVLDDPEADLVEEYDLVGIEPKEHVVGGTLLPVDDDKYLIFDAIQFDEFGAPFKSGKAVVQLKDCLASRFRSLGDEEHLAAHAVDFSALESFGIYEVSDSTWISNLLADPANLAWTADSAPELRHFIFTFKATAFECVVSELAPFVYTWSFAEVYDFLVEI